MGNYQPKIAVHPGKTLRMHLEYYGVSHKWLADRTGLTEKHISEIANEKALISADTAARLAKVLGGSVEFWINLDANYRANKIRLEMLDEAAKEADMLEEIPYKTLTEAGYVKNSANNAEKVLNLQKFFGVNSLHMVLDSQKMALRKGGDEPSDPYLMAAWLRKGEIEASEKMTDIGEYDRSGLIDALPVMRRWVLKSLDEVFDDLSTILNKNGVILVMVAPLEGMQVKGATRWIGKNPVVQITNKWDNIEESWFTLFHEIGHVVLHGRKDKFLEYFDEYENETDEEKESAADDFAKEQMFLGCIVDDRPFAHMKSTKEC